MAQAFCNVRGPFLLPEGQITLLVLSRYALVPAPDGVAKTQNGKTTGVEIVAYRCDEYGHVSDWERRYETSGVDGEAAVNRLRHELINGLLSISNYEGITEMIEQARQGSFTVNWEQMPANLQ